MLHKLTIILGLLLIGWLLELAKNIALWRGAF